MLTVHNLGKRLDHRWLWTEVSFSITAGSRWGLVGASGSGKSMLLRALAGLIPIEVGQIEFQGQGLSQWAMPEYRSLVMYTTQRPALFEGVVEENLRSILSLKVHQHRSYDRDKIVNYLQSLGRSSDFLSLSADTLSGGESQILGLLRALQLDPVILLLDEPTASLDPQTTAQVEALIDRWMAQDAQRACIWTSHSAEQIDRVSEYRYVLEKRS